MHAAAHAYVARLADARGPVGLVVEVGSLDINGGVRGLWQAETYVGVDVVPGPGVDVVADGATYQAPGPVDVAVCCEVLEHTPHGAAIVANLARQLTPGGWLVLTAAGPDRAPHSAVDGGPLRPGEWYRNVTTAELWAYLLLAGLDVREVRDEGVDVQAWAVRA